MGKHHAGLCLCVQRLCLYPGSRISRCVRSVRVGSPFEGGSFPMARQYAVDIDVCLR